ncbi:hypothetical protein IT570_12560 [Candidatus Sumerlaeota bacterium]|nr:hypothetical protein [Candidatus Sumerlaeota bacterium]
MESNRGPEFFTPVGEVGAAKPEPSNTTQSDSEGASEASSESVAAQKLWEDIRAFALHLKPLLCSYSNYLRAHFALTSFVARERARLAAARFFLWTCAVIMLALCWIFLSMFLWRAAISLTHQPAAGPLILVLTHGGAAFALLATQKRLKL